MKAAKSRQIVPNDAGTAAAWEEGGVAITEADRADGGQPSRGALSSRSILSRFGRYVRRRRRQRELSARNSARHSSLKARSGLTAWLLIRSRNSEKVLLGVE